MILSCAKCGKLYSSDGGDQLIAGAVCSCPPEDRPVRFAGPAFPSKIPHKCPICEGRGLVPGGFYTSVAGQESWSSNCAAETCRSCSGSGLIFT